MHLLSQNKWACFYFGGLWLIRIGNVKVDVHGSILERHRMLAFVVALLLLPVFLVNTGNVGMFMTLTFLYLHAVYSRFIDYIIWHVRIKMALREDDIRRHGGQTQSFPEMWFSTGLHGHYSGRYWELVRNITSILEVVPVDQLLKSHIVSSLLTFYSIVCIVMDQLSNDINIYAFSFAKVLSQGWFYLARF